MSTHAGALSKAARARTMRDTFRKGTAGYKKWQKQNRYWSDRARVLAGRPPKRRITIMPPPTAPPVTEKTIFVPTTAEIPEKVTPAQLASIQYAVAKGQVRKIFARPEKYTPETLSKLKTDWSEYESGYQQYQTDVKKYGSEVEEYRKQLAQYEKERAAYDQKLIDYHRDVRRIIAQRKGEMGRAPPKRVPLLYTMGKKTLVSDTARTQLERAGLIEEFEENGAKMIRLTKPVAALTAGQIRLARMTGFDIGRGVVTQAGISAKITPRVPIKHPLLYLTGPIKSAIEKFYKAGDFLTQADIAKMTLEEKKALALGGIGPKEITPGTPVSTLLARLGYAIGEGVVLPAIGITTFPFSIGGIPPPKRVEDVYMRVFGSLAMPFAVPAKYTVTGRALKYVMDKGYLRGLVNALKRTKPEVLTETKFTEIPPPRGVRWYPTRELKVGEAMRSLFDEPLTTEVDLTKYGYEFATKSKLARGFYPTKTEQLRAMNIFDDEFVRDSMLSLFDEVDPRAWGELSYKAKQNIVNRAIAVFKSKRGSVMSPLALFEHVKDLPPIEREYFIPALMGVVGITQALSTIIQTPIKDLDPSQVTFLEQLQKQFKYQAPIQPTLPAITPITEPTLDMPVPAPPIVKLEPVQIVTPVIEPVEIVAPIPVEITAPIEEPIFEPPPPPVPPIQEQIQRLRQQLRLQGVPGQEIETRVARLRREHSRRKEARRILPSKDLEPYRVSFQYPTRASESFTVRARTFRHALAVASERRRVRIRPMEVEIEALEKVVRRAGRR